MFKIRLGILILLFSLSVNAYAATKSSSANFRAFHAAEVLKPDVFLLDSGDKVKLAGVTFAQDKESGALEAVKKIVSEVAPNWGASTEDPKVILETREKIAAEILKLKK